MMPIPEHRPLDPAFFRARIEELAKRGGVAAAHLGIESGMPARPRGGSGITWVPFLMVCLQGEMDVRLWRDGAERSLRVPAGEALFFAPGAWVSCHHQRCPLYARITFDEDHTLFALKDLSLARRGEPPIDLHAVVVERVLPAEGLGIVRRLLQVPDGPLRAIRAGALVDALLWECHDLLVDAELARSGRSYTAWLGVRDFLARRWQEPLSRGGVARAFAVSPGHISRLFSRHGGSSFIAYLQDLRLRQAELLLLSTSLDLGRIARHCALGSATYFIRLFRRRHGCTPAQFRQRRRA